MNQELIIIDNGSNSCKAGFSDDDMPTVDIPTVIGYPKDQDEVGDSDQRDTIVGEEALSKVGILNNFYPIRKGEIVDLQKIQEIWKHIFYSELIADTKTHPVIMTDSVFSDYKSRDKMAEILFNDMNIENLYITNTSTLALYANGKTTGLVVDIGYETTSCVPIYEGFVLNHAVSRVELGGNHLTEYLCDLINKNKENPQFEIRNEAKKEMINWLKEKKCEVTEDYDSQVKRDQDNKNSGELVLLPDNNTIVRLGSERYACPELLFQPIFFDKKFSALGQEQPSPIHEQAFKAIKKCDDDIQKDLFLNTVLCGGSSLFMKIKPRFEKELQSLAPTGKTAKVIAPPERKYSAWLGGSILGSLSNFRNTMFVSKKEYIESGANAIYKKFF
jgi:actin-related protein